MLRGLLCLLLLTISSALYAQEPAPFGHTRRGTISAIRSDAGTLALKESDGVVRAYHLLERVFFRKQRQEALLQDFTNGESVVIQIRLNRDTSAYEVLGMMDSASYQWLAHLRSTLLRAPILALEEDRLTLRVEERTVPYVIDQKTRWYRQGREVSKSTFQVGEWVWVSPESLTRGEVLARGVATNREDLSKADLSTEYNLRGKLLKWEPTTPSLLLRLPSGATQTFTYNTPPELRQRSKPTTQEQIQTAIEKSLPICLRLKRYPNTDLVVRITIEQTIRRQKPNLKEEKKQ